MDGELYPSARSVRNVDSEGRLERVLSEPLPGEVRPRLPGAAEPLDQARSPLRLGREGRDRLGDPLRRDPVPAQVVADPLVAVATVRQGLRPGAGEPRVIDVPDALERVERVGPQGLVDTGAREPLLDLSPRAVSVLQRARRDLDRVLLAHPGL